jgi:hypothetical protein
MTAQIIETFAIVSGASPLQSLELTEEGSSSSATKQRFCQGSTSPGQEASGKGAYGPAAQAS